MSAPQSRHPLDDQGYITLDTYNPKKGDPGGFGFGGSNGSTGGFGVGGQGPQPGLDQHRRAHAHDHDSFTPGASQNDRVTPPVRAAGVDTHQHDADYPKWIDGFPHSFHGWGPNTPDEHAHEQIAPQHDRTVTGDASRADKANATPEIRPPLLFAIQDFDPFASTLVWTSKR